MNSPRMQSIRPASLIVAAVFACTTAVAGVADNGSARAEGEKYRQACMAGQTNQDRATCLKEANNYLADLKKNPGKFQGNATAAAAANAKARCEALSGSDRTACMARISGQGKVSGSVEGGGIYRELVTRESPQPIVQDATPPAPADSPAKQ